MRSVQQHLAIDLTSTTAHSEIASMENQFHLGKNSMALPFSTCLTLDIFWSKI
jgi:hypothetical protein